MADPETRWRNLAKLQARLGKVPEAVRQALADQLAKEAEDLVAAEQRAAPVSELEDHPGQLRDSIQSYPNPDRPLSFRIIAAARDKAGRLFARYVEFGHTTAGGKYVPAHAFWFPTYRARRKAMRRRLTAAPRKALKALFPGDANGDR
jgi:hypothetical protein